MPDIGKVVVTPGKNIGTVSVKGTVPTAVANPNYTPSVEISTQNITNFSTDNVENGYTFIYNSVTQKYEASPINIADVNITLISGGTF